MALSAPSMGAWQMGCKSPVNEAKHENMKIKSPVEVNSGRVTDRVNEGSREAAKNAKEELHRNLAELGGTVGSQCPISLFTIHYSHFPDNHLD